MTSEPISVVLARWIGALRLDDVPADVRQKARLCCADTLGVALAGSRMPSVRCAIRAMGGGPSQYGFWGTKEGGALASALFVNATAASALDLEDGHPLAVGHPSSGVISAAFTVAERLNPPGRALLEAVIVGYEIGIRAAVARRAQNVDAFCSGNWLPIGVAAALGRLNGLAENSLAHALAIAAAYTPQAPLSPSLENGAMVKESIGWATVVGQQAVALAAADFRGGLTILEHEGLYRRDAWLDGLGERWALRQVYFKPYAACRWTHAPADATLQLVHTNGLRVQDVQAVLVETFHAAARLNHPAPVSLEHAQYSIPWIVALILRDGDAGARQMREEFLADKSLLSLAGRVQVAEAADLEATFPETRSARVTLTTTKGKFTATVHHPRGSQDNPLSEEWIQTRARELAGEILGEKAAINLIGGMKDLEQSVETAPLIQTLRIKQ
jgi:2-methylcitrate dehydratase PrpD